MIKNVWLENKLKVDFHHFYGGWHFKQRSWVSSIGKCFFFVFLCCLQSILWMDWTRYPWLETEFFFVWIFFQKTLSFTSFATLCVLSVHSSSPGFEDKVVTVWSWISQGWIFIPSCLYQRTKFRLHKQLYWTGFKKQVLKRKKSLFVFLKKIKNREVPSFTIGFYNWILENIFFAHLETIFLRPCLKIHPFTFITYNAMRLKSF